MGIVFDLIFGAATAVALGEVKKRSPARFWILVTLPWLFVALVFGLIYYFNGWS